MVLAGVEGLLLDPGLPQSVKVYGALGDRDQFFKVEDGMVQRLYAESPPFPVTSNAPSPCSRKLHSRGHTRPDPDREMPGLLAGLLDADVVNLGAPGLDGYDILEIVEEIAPSTLKHRRLHRPQRPRNAVFESRYGTPHRHLRLHLW